MKRTFYLGRTEYSSFESAYVLGKFNFCGDFKIKSYTDCKQFSKFVWRDDSCIYMIKGVKSLRKKEIIKENLSLYDCYKDVIKNAKEYFISYDRLSICPINENNPILIIDIDYLEVLIDVVKVLDKNNARYSLDDLTDDYLNININEIKNERKKSLEKEVSTKISESIKPKEAETKKVANKKVTDKKKVSNLTKEEIIDITSFNTPIFEERKIIDKEYWVEIRLQTSTIVDKTEKGDWKSTLELYNNLREEFPNKEIALVKNDNGVPFDCFKSSKTPGSISIELVLQEYRNILNSLNNIKRMKAYAEEEAVIKNRECILSSHILESSSFFFEEDFKKKIIAEKCRLDDRRDIKTLMEVSNLLPNENKLETTIVESLLNVQKRLNSYVKYGKNYLNNNGVHDIFYYKDEEEYEKLYSEKKNKYKTIKKSNFNKRIHCFSGKDNVRKES